MITLAPEAILSPEGLLHHVIVGLDGDRIAFVRPAHRNDPPADVALPGRILLPGLVNAHSHAFQRAFRGHVQSATAGRDDFWTWRERMYAVANTLDPDGVEAVSALAFLEMAEAGVTHVGEFHYLHHGPGGAPYADPDELAHRVVAAARRVGLRITLLRVAYARGGPGQPPSPEQLRFVDESPDHVLAALERLTEHHRDPAVHIGLAAHSVRALDTAWLRVLSAWSGVVHAHVSEQPAENEACLAEHGRSPLAVLHDAGLVHDRFTAVHLTWPLEGDVDRLAAAGGGVCACPTTELDLGDGFVPADVLARVPVCVGTDSHARIDVLEDARSLEMHARAVQGRRLVLAPPTGGSGLAMRLLDAATVQGSAALGQPAPGLIPGAPADLVALDLRRTAALGVPPLEAAAFVATPEWVSHSWVAGQPVMVDGVHPQADAIAAAARPYLR